jgi:hypothetical protein
VSGTRNSRVLSKQVTKQILKSRTRTFMDLTDTSTFDVKARVID